MKIFKNRDVKTPTRGTSVAAGLDFYVPNDFPGTHYLAPGQSVNIPSGIHCAVPSGKALVFMDKSGVSLKKELKVGACVIDEDYQGEVQIHLFNIGDKVAEINPGDKIIQGLLLDVSYELAEESDSLEELYGGQKTERGEGKFGSTGTK